MSENFEVNSDRSSRDAEGISVVYENFISRIKPGAKPGQIILGIDITEARGDDGGQAILRAIEEMGYPQKLNMLELPTGFHVFLVLHHEQKSPDTVFPEDYWAEEVQTLKSRFPVGIKLWRGEPENTGGLSSSAE